MTNTKPEFPVSVGEAVGWFGIRSRIMRIYPGTHEVDIATPNVKEWRRVQISELTDPPPLPDRISQHVPALAAHLGNPRAIFDEEG